MKNKNTMSPKSSGTATLKRKRDNVMYGRELSAIASIAGGILDRLSLEVLKRKKYKSSRGRREENSRREHSNLSGKEGERSKEKVKSAII